MKINSIYPSISGEVGKIIPQGHPCLIIRTQGCNLRCEYCDAIQTQNNVSGIDYSVDHLISIAKKEKFPILLTGGEPLLQKEVTEFLQKCVENYITVQVETNGTCKLPTLPGNVSFIVDHKFGQKGIVHYIDDLGENDYVKFVVCDMNELLRSCTIIESHEGSCTNWAISPVQFPKSLLVQKGISAKEISDHLIKHSIGAVLNVQIHKLIDLP